MLMEVGAYFLARKTPRIYNRLAFVNTIAQIFHTGSPRGIDKRDTTPSLHKTFTRQSQPRAAVQTTHIEPLAEAPVAVERAQLGAVVRGANAPHRSRARAHHQRFGRGAARA